MIYLRAQCSWCDFRSGIDSEPAIVIERNGEDFCCCWGRRAGSPLADGGALEY
jgi:hypothetical protein